MGRSDLNRSTTMIHIYTLALAVVALPFASVVANAAELAITVKEVRNASGWVLIAVYDSDASFLKLQLAKAELKAHASKGEVKFVVHDLPPGKYAVTAFHDENDNGKLDKNWLGVPTEGYGFSNEAKGSFGPPKFDRAVFDFDGKTDKAISFSLNY